MLRPRRLLFAKEANFLVPVARGGRVPASEQKIEQENAESENNRDSIGGHEP